MSLLTDFAKAGFAQASQVIGTETIAIDGGDAVAVVRNEIENAREFEDGGFAPGADVVVVASRTVFVSSYASAASSYVGKTAVMGGTTYRVQTIRDGNAHTTIALVHQEVSA